MFPNAWCDFALLVAMLVELFFEEILCKDARLWETVHSLLDFDIYCTVIISKVFEVVGFDRIGRELADFHAHVFRSVHGCVEKEILEIYGVVACVLC